MKINLFTTFYTDANVLRHQEYIASIKKNLSNDLITTITFILEPNQLIPIKNDKIRTIHVKARPTFKEFTQVIIKLGNQDEFNIIANTDIYFDSTIIKINDIEFDNTVLCLNRWDIIDENQCQFFNKYYTTDTWIFKGLPPLINAYYYLGQPGCDNRFNYDLYNAGLQLKNPSLSIYTWHIHQSNVRSYLEPNNNINRVSKPYLYLLPELIDNPKRDLNFITKRRLFRQIRYEIYKEILIGEIDAEIYLLVNKSKINAFIMCIYYFNYSRIPVTNITFQIKSLK